MRIWVAAVFGVLCGMAVLPAAARPQDDAMAGAYRCAAIADTRTWLDCYYGAAQPVRAALNLAPAGAGQQQLVQAPPAGGVPRDEEARDQVMAGAAGCSRAAGPRAWLDCYYAAARPVQAVLGLVKTAPAPVMPMPQRAAPQPQGLPPMPRTRGLMAGLVGTTRPVVNKVPMESFTMDKNGAFTVTLADGEIWRQSQEDAVYHPAHWREAGPGTLVTIRPDAMNTFTMEIVGEQRIYKVRRIH